MAQYCLHCGGTSFHYNSGRMRMECSSCGTPLNEYALQEQQMQYDRMYSQAMSHLLAGNWDQTISQLKPLTNQYPTDKKLYIALLRATTRDFSDIEMQDSNKRAIASDSWDKLVRLRGVTSDMIRYGMNRYERHMFELRRQKNIVLNWLFSVSIAIFLMGLTISQKAIFASLILLIFSVVGFYNLVNRRPIEVVKQLSAEISDYHRNPFL